MATVLDHLCIVSKEIEEFDQAINVSIDLKLKKDERIASTTS